jgi:aryl-alcohol dehydrogenase-like predicted oxidoreductase
MKPPFAPSDLRVGVPPRRVSYTMMLVPNDGIPDVFSAPESYRPAPLQLPLMGAGTLSWGNPRRGWGINFNSTDLASAFDILTEGGVTFFDTSEVYGYQGIRLAEGSEQLLGTLTASAPNPPLVSSKYMPIPWANLLVGGGVRLGRSAVLEALRNSIARMGLASVDVYSVHAPLPHAGGRRAMYEGLAEAYDLGLCRGVGVCNFNVGQTREAMAACRQLGVPLVSNQIKYSVLNIEREMDGTIETCLELGIVPVAHTPLACGLATSRYARSVTSRNAKRARMGRWDMRHMVALQRVYDALGVAVEGHEGRTETQAALRFVMSKGCVPIPGVVNAEQAAEVVGALQWDLELDELQSISNQAHTLYHRRNDLPGLRNL